MAKFDMELPTDVMNDIRKIETNADAIFGKMTKAAADAVCANVKANAPTAELKAAAKVTRTYKTPSDDGINNKVIFGGYLPFKGGRSSFDRRGKAKSKVYSTDKGIPMEFVAIVTEYGTSERFTDMGAYRGKIRKKPFFRKGFKAEQITAIMKRVQLEESGGLLTDEQ